MVSLRTAASRAIAGAGLGLVLNGAPAAAGSNPNVTLPLHAKVAQSAPCNGYLPVDCLSVPPTVNVPANSQVVIYLFVNNFNRVSAVQTAFEWDPGWTLIESRWNCQPSQVVAVSPQNPGGPQYGALMTAFNCAVGPTLIEIGCMTFTTGSWGCLRQMAPIYPGGISVWDCNNQPDSPSYEARLGTVCVGYGGRDACSPIVTVEPATWGGIKSTYR